MQDVSAVHVTHSHGELSHPSYDDIAVVALAGMTLAPDVSVQCAASREFHKDAERRLSSAPHERAKEAYYMRMVERGAIAHLYYEA